MLYYAQIISTAYRYGYWRSRNGKSFIDSAISRFSTHSHQICTTYLSNAPSCLDIGISKIITDSAARCMNDCIKMVFNWAVFSLSLWCLCLKSTTKRQGGNLIYLNESNQNLIYAASLKTSNVPFQRPPPFEQPGKPNTAYQLNRSP